MRPILHVLLAGSLLAGCSSSAGIADADLEITPEDPCEPVPSWCRYDAAPQGRSDADVEDAAAIVGCPFGCPDGTVCLIAGYLRGDLAASCQPVPAQCRADGGPADGGATCNRCAGEALCQGAAACLEATGVVYCGR